MSGKVSARPRKPRASDFIEKATAEGEPLPLEVLLDSMWSFLDQARRLESSRNPDDAILARIARLRALRVAEVAAPYVHPRMAATTVAANDDASPVHVRPKDPFASLSEAQATRYLDAISAGTMTIEQVDAELR